MPEILPTLQERPPYSPPRRNVFAADLHISPQLLNDILASRRLLTTEHCLKLGRYFGNEPEYWMRLQNHYLFRKNQREKASELDAVVPLQIAS